MAGTIRLSRTVWPVTVLGFGTRLGIWLQGCPLACQGCMARDTWDPAGGQEKKIDDLVDEWQTALTAGANGLTISGGEPLAQPAALGELLRRMDLARAGRRADILVYTGYEAEELEPEQRAALTHADVVMTGRYDVRRPTELAWRGSANQRMWLRTPLAEQRYASFVNAPLERRVMQAVIENGNVTLIGIPRHGDLHRLEKGLRTSGVPMERVTWRRGERQP